MLRIYFMIMEISRKLSKDNISGYAAQSCFYIVLSFFPCLLLLMSLIRFLPVSPDTLTTIVRDIAPHQLYAMFVTMISELYSESTTTFTVFSAIGMIWAAGKGFMAIIKGFDTIYEVKKQRNWFLQRIFSTIYTIIFIVLILVTLVLLVFGNQLIEISSSFAPRFSSMMSSILNNRTLLFPVVLLSLFLFMFTFIPNRKSSIAKEFPGALIAALGWYLFSYFYSLYVNYSPNFSLMYGSLTTLIFALIWIYSCMIILFFGAEFNTFISKHYLAPICRKNYLPILKKYQLKNSCAEADKAGISGSTQPEHAGASDFTQTGHAGASDLAQPEHAGASDLAQPEHAGISDAAQVEKDIL